MWRCQAEKGIEVIVNSLLEAVFSQQAQQMDTADEAIAVLHALVTDETMRQLAGGLPDVLDAIETVLGDNAPTGQAPPISDMVRANASMIRNEVSECDV